MWSRVVLASVFAAALAVAGCGGSDDSARIIAETCVKDGGPAETCECLGRESVKRLDEDSLDAVVFGALGEDVEADKVLAEMGEARAVQFAGAMQEVIRACGAQDYVNGS